MIAPVVAGLSGCAASNSPKVSQAVVELRSPAVEPAAARRAWRLAEAYAANQPDCEVVVGSGNSMLPLYPDRTVLVVRRARPAELSVGMTVVFVGDHGRLVAHSLIEKSDLGWLAKGMGNAEPDATLVRRGNLVGIVVRAFRPADGESVIARAIAESPAKPLAVAQD
ncbi:MAG: hypothetical protein HZA93_14655 [Verrucomicrobia bacterium]|nr:hypothetical protein [Verrucomicrobiota bacterium]